MGHKVLLPVDVVLKIINFCLSWGQYSGIFAQFQRETLPTGAAKNSFSIYRVNAVGMTASERNLNAYNVLKQGGIKNQNNIAI